MAPHFPAHLFDLLWKENFKYSVPVGMVVYEEPLSWILAKMAFVCFFLRVLRPSRNISSPPGTPYGGQVAVRHIDDCEAHRTRKGIP